LFYSGKSIEGGMTLVSEIFIYFVQNLFRIREKHFRDSANLKMKHLEIGNYWTLATQSISAISDINKRNEQLSKLIDYLNERIKP
jgi:hypothetical protein